MNIEKGFLATQQVNYQLNVINLIKHGIRNFKKQEILSRRPDGSFFRYTYYDAYERMHRLANALITIGVKSGDRVGVLSWNHHQYFEIYFGLPGMGAVMITLNLRLGTEDLAYILNHSGTKFILVDEDLLYVAESVAPLCESLRGYIIITDKSLDEIDTNLEPVYSYEALLNNAESSYQWPNLDENSAYAACYTTGTTGKPKGVYYSHRNVYIHALMFAAQLPFSVNDVVLQLVPMFHVLGWSKPLAATYAGSKIIFSGKWNLNDLKELTDLMVSERVTVSGAVPAVLMTMLEFIRKLEKKPDLTGTKLISGGSEPPISLMRGFWDETGGEIIHSYGSTEAMAITTLNLFKPWLKKELTEEELWELKKKQGTIVSGLDIEIVDDEGKFLPHDGKSSGEILLRGPWVTKSYYNDDKTKTSFTNDGYLKTGDAGCLDEEGYLKITDRIKDVIKSGGEWISSIDLENRLVSHSFVLEAAVIGIKHPKWDERPLALIKLRPEIESLEKKELIEFLLNKFPRWQIPDDFLFVDEIPKTSVGKLNKKVIRERYK
ncbi:MAG: long-chain-fatty-acid--CoA ligase, partial [Candidatus Hermodarchaeota archaeon]